MVWKYLSDSVQAESYTAHYCSHDEPITPISLWWPIKIIASAPRLPIRISDERINVRTLAVEAAIDTEDSHILEVKEGIGRLIAVEESTIAMKMLLQLLLLRKGLHLPG